MLASRVLGAEDLGDLVWGHASARDPDGRGVWMKASTYGLEEVDADRVLLVGWDGEVLSGEGRRHAEYPIHTEAMLARDDVGGVVHVHAPHAIAFSATGLPLRPVSHEGCLFTPPGVPVFDETGDLILTSALGAAVARRLGPHPAAFLRNHGIVTVGPDVATATVVALLLERACRIQLLTLSAGGDLLASSDEEALRKRDNCYPAPLLRQAWDYLVRRLPT